MLAGLTGWLALMYSIQHSIVTVRSLPSRNMSLLLSLQRCLSSRERSMNTFPLWPPSWSVTETLPQPRTPREMWMPPIASGRLHCHRAGGRLSCQCSMLPWCSESHCRNRLRSTRHVHLQCPVPLEFYPVLSIETRSFWIYGKC